ncbi:MAG: haloalkane dehalogenase [Sphingomonadales bacterium 28-55-16]|nr:MAG: haloalkane dehalogenase [Sphingomonadales bacterium 28-55-16]
MKVLRTPEAVFAGIRDYPFVAHYLEVDAPNTPPLRLHYVDEGPSDAAPILLLHGEPTWSYLYRKFIPVLAGAGHRVLAPDLIGFGKSDKPTSRDDYSYERHVAWMGDWLTQLDLNNITLFCQDWGGLIGLRLVAAFPDRFARLVISNTYLPIGENISAGFDAWRTFSQVTPEFKTGRIVDGGCNRALTSAEIAAYDAPFPDESFKAGARKFPVLVPITPEHPSVSENRAAWAQLECFEKPVLTCFGDQDKVLGHLDTEIQRRIPGAKGQPHCRIDASHFCQEDQPEQLVDLILNFIAAQT